MQGHKVMVMPKWPEMGIPSILIEEWKADPSKRYDVYTTDGTCYDNATIVKVDDGGMFIKYHDFSIVFIAPHEYEYVADATGDDDATVYYK